MSKERWTDIKDEETTKTIGVILTFFTELLEGARFYDELQAKRILKRFLESRKIQGFYDQQGDKLWNSWVDKNYPNNGDFKTEVFNEMLKSNWFLEKIFVILKVPVSKYIFINEKVYRQQKRGASLIEWFLGFLWYLTKDKKGAKTATERVHRFIDEDFAVRLKLSDIELGKFAGEYLNFKKLKGKE